jgi:hypothetical protein
MELSLVFEIFGGISHINCFFFFFKMVYVINLLAETFRYVRESISMSQSIIQLTLDMIDMIDDSTYYKIII